MPISPRVPDLPALDLLLSVIELGSLGRAAEAHGISQPSASSRIRYLEKLVGLPVLERSSLGSKPTPAGALIAEWARTVIDAAHELDAGIGALRERRSSHLKVAASQTVAEYLVPKWLIGLRAQHPATSVALESGNSADVARAVLDGRAELGFIESPRAPKGLESHAVARDRLLVVVAPAHPWARRTAITLDELATASLIQREADRVRAPPSSARSRPTCPTGSPPPCWNWAPPPPSRPPWPAAGAPPCSARSPSPTSWPPAPCGPRRSPVSNSAARYAPSGPPAGVRPGRPGTCTPWPAGSSPRGRRRRKVIDPLYGSIDPLPLPGRNSPPEDERVSLR